MIVCLSQRPAQPDSRAGRNVRSRRSACEARPNLIDSPRAMRRGRRPLLPATRLDIADAAPRRGSPSCCWDQGPTRATPGLWSRVASAMSAFTWAVTPVS